MTRQFWLFATATLCAALLAAPSLADDASRSRKSRARRTNPKQELVTKKSEDKTPSSRYQMLAAGQRVIILDTHTGETKIIEPETRPALQQVEVQRAWVVVSVIGNVSEPKPAMPR